VDTDEDVLRRHVAMHEAEERAAVVAELVSTVEPCEPVDEHAERDRRGQALLLPRRARQESRERVALDVLHHEVVAERARAHFENRNDIRMVNAGRESRFVEEHLDELFFAREMWMKALDGDETAKAADAAQACEIHGGHAARRDLADELVAIDS